MRRVVVTAIRFFSFLTSFPALPFCARVCVFSSFHRRYKSFLVWVASKKKAGSGPGKAVERKEKKTDRESERMRRIYTTKPTVSEAARDRRRGRRGSIYRRAPCGGFASAPGEIYGVSPEEADTNGRAWESRNTTLLAVPLFCFKGRSLYFFSHLSRPTEELHDGQKTAALLSCGTPPLRCITSAEPLSQCCASRMISGEYIDAAFSRAADETSAFGSGLATQCLSKYVDYFHSTL